jgi:hypothetical protein
MKRFTFYNICFIVLNKTIGKIIRFFQSMSLTRPKINIHDLLYQKAMQDSAELVYVEMQQAIFLIKEKVYGIFVYRTRI